MRSFLSVKCTQLHFGRSRGKEVSFAPVESPECIIAMTGGNEVEW